jgi:hypothetical protein
MKKNQSPIRVGASVVFKTADGASNSGTVVAVSGALVTVSYHLTGRYSHSAQVDVKDVVPFGSASFLTLE